MSEKFLYTGLVFPVELNDVPKVEIQNELQPVIDVKKVAAQSIRSFATTDHQITGNELAFIRVYLQMPIDKFAKLIQSSATEVKAWEALEDKPDNVEKSLKQQLQTPKSSLGLFSSSNDNKPSDPSPTDSNKPKPKK
jgi:DNA-binding transcriptional regulator YiaG